MNSAAWFLLPQAAWLLLLAPALVLATWAGRVRRRRKLQQLARGHGTEHQERSAELAYHRRVIHGGGRWRGWSACAGLAFAALAAMQPAWGKGRSALHPQGADLIIALDVSRSMLARDLQPDRLERAREEIRQLASAAAGCRIGVVIFAGEARLWVPLSDDLVSVADLVGLAQPAALRRGGTDLGAALQTAAAALPEPGDRPQAVLLISDGEDLAGSGLRVAVELAQDGVVVHTVGMASSGGSKIVVPGEDGETFLQDQEGQDVLSRLDPTSLQAIAAATGGRYLEVGVAGFLRVPVLADILSRAPQSSAEDSTPPRNRYVLFLLVAFLLFLPSYGRHAARG